MTYTHVRDLLGLFRNGYDTSHIAHLTGFHEHYVYNQLHEQREAERLRKFAFREKPDLMVKMARANEQSYPKLIPYAGKDD